MANKEGGGPKAGLTQRDVAATGFVSTEEEARCEGRACSASLAERGEQQAASFLPCVTLLRSAVASETEAPWLFLSL